MKDMTDVLRHINEGLLPPDLRNIVSLIKWRDSVDTKKKARAIQRVIDKKYAALSDIEKTSLICYKVSAW